MAKPKKDKWYIRALKKLGWTVLVSTIVFVSYKAYAAHEYKQVVHARGTANPIPFTLNVSVPMNGNEAVIIVVTGRHEKWRSFCPKHFTKCELNLSGENLFLEGDQLHIEAWKPWYTCLSKCTIADNTIALRGDSFAKRIDAPKGTAFLTLNLPSR